jgi:hypothetical protein
MIALYAERRDWEFGVLVVEVEYDPEAVPRDFEVTNSFDERIVPAQRARNGQVGQLQGPPVA